jgi:hypothetical protein
MVSKPKRNSCSQKMATDIQNNKNNFTTGYIKTDSENIKNYAVYGCCVIFISPSTPTK